MSNPITITKRYISELNSTSPTNVFIADNSVNSSIASSLSGITWSGNTLIIQGHLYVSGNTGSYGDVTAYGNVTESPVSWWDELPSEISGIIGSGLTVQNGLLYTTGGGGGSDASLSSVVSSEISNRINGDTSLSTAISTRVSVDTSLSSAISTRISVDNTISSSLSSHIGNTSNPHSTTATQVGLGNVTNESKSTMFSNPTFTGTATIGNNGILCVGNSNEIWYDGNQASDAGTLYINYRGYQGAQSYYRDTVICNGKGGTVLFVDGSSSNIGISNTTILPQKLNIGTIGSSIPTGNGIAAENILSAVSGNKMIYLYNNGSTLKLDAYDYATSTALDVTLGGNGGNINTANANFIIRKDNSNGAGAWLKVQNYTYPSSNANTTGIDLNFGIENRYARIYAYQSTSGYGYVGSLRFGLVNLSDNYNDILTIKSDGCVGINNINPSEKLIVNGRIFANTYPDNCFILNSAGANYGFIGTDTANEWWLGYGTSTSTIGSKTLKWNASGHIYVTNNIYAGGEITAYYSSDKRLKENISDFSALSIINQLRPVSFNWNEKAKELNSSKDDRLNYGLIAQEVEITNPELVHRIYDKYKSIDYVQLVPILIQAIKEQQIQIDELKKKLK